MPQASYLVWLLTVHIMFGVLLQRRGVRQAALLSGGKLLW